MKMNRYAVCLFTHHQIDNNSQFRTVYALSPEQALAQALNLPSPEGITAAGSEDGINFFDYKGQEHIVHALPNGL